jgi:hypothetical protein
MVELEIEEEWSKRSSWWLVDFRLIVDIALIAVGKKTIFRQTGSGGEYIYIYVYILYYVWLWDEEESKIHMDLLELR